MPGLAKYRTHKYLHQRKQPAKNTLAGIFFNLVSSLQDGNATLFKFKMDKRHAVDEQHDVAPPVVQNAVRGKLGLLHYLVAALACG